MSALFGTNDADTLVGAGGADTLDGAPDGSPATDVGADTLRGEAGSDLLRGRGGDDVLDGGTGADTLEGGTGNDLFVVDDAGDLLSDGGGADTVMAWLTWTLPAFAEVLLLLGPALFGTGNAVDNALHGNDGANTLNGAGGADTLHGGEGDDTLQGAAGNDILFGGSGGDSVWGGPGADTMFGGAGDDLYHLDNAGDTISEAGGGGVDLVFALLTFSLPGGFENLTLTGGAAINGTGNGLANIITGNNAANLLVGGGGHDSLAGMNGADTLNGGAGADTMAGGLGADRYVVDSLLDLLIENPGEGNDEVIAAVSWTLGEAFEALVLNGAADLGGTGNAAPNRIVGNAGANELSGLDGNDNLIGGEGADTLIGGAGRDALSGGAGGDLFVIGSATEGPDKIVDLVPGEDRIVFAASGFAGGLAPGPLDPAHFVAHAASGATAPAGTAQFIYNTALGALFFDADGIGGVAVIRIATLVGAPPLAAGDIVMI